MLKGRESLLRIIGKRRRFLPNRRSILSSSQVQSFFSLCNENGYQKKDSMEERTDLGEESVNCPVCGYLFPSQDNTVVNSHLDECLARGGSKRKLSQLTLLQLNFSKSKVKDHSVQPDNIGYQVIPSDPNASSTCDNLHEMKESNSSEEYDNNQQKSTFNCTASRNNPLASCKENLFVNDIINDKSASPQLVSENSRYVPKDCLDDLDISKVFIPTVIVGRRYGKREKLDPESRICLSRDPENVKDPNAIMVMYADSDYDNMLGYLPQELAQYLSPLMDTFHLIFEGHITSVPKDYRAAVPIQIVCKNVELAEKKDCDNIQDFKTLWRHVLHSAELSKTNFYGARYQHNMVLIILEVLKSSPHVFTIIEKSFLESFNSLSDDSQRLFARLYTRKVSRKKDHMAFFVMKISFKENNLPDFFKARVVHDGEVIWHCCSKRWPWFRMSNVSYPEISDSNQAIKGLSEAGYISSFPWRNKVDDSDLEEVLNVLNREELRAALRMLNKKCAHGTRKQDIIDLLLSSCRHCLCPELQAFVLARTGACIQISPLAESLIWRAERLFFLNGEQGLSTFLLADLGIVKYPAYNCVITEPIFTNRSDFLSYEEAVEISQIMDESLDENNSELILRCIDISDSRILISSGGGKHSSGKSMATFVSYFSASWIYSKVVLLGVSFLEREKRYNDAINLLRRLLNTFISDGRRGYWALRLSVNLEHLGCLEDSLQAAEEGLLDPWVRAGSRVALQRRVLRLGKPPRRWKVPSYFKSVKREISEVQIQGRPLNCKTGTKNIFYGENGEQCEVEQLALEYYAGEGGGWQGVHTESGIWLTIFGILMWDIIFADVPNVFRTKFQTAPLDLETDCFYEVRKSLIEELLEKIRDGAAEELLITTWESHFGTACRGVNWDKHPLSELRAVVTCIGGASLASICRHLAQDYHSWSSGMPDLLLWLLHNCYRGEAKLVEVKGPNDRLSEQQRAWLLVLMDCGFNVEVCKVTPAPLAM